MDWSKEYETIAAELIDSLDIADDLGDEELSVFKENVKRHLQVFKMRVYSEMLETYRRAREVEKTVVISVRGLESDLEKMIGGTHDAMVGNMHIRDMGR